MKSIITILTICLLAFAGTQSAQAQTFEYSDYPRFMRNYWKQEYILTKMITNQLLETKTGKVLIEAYEKGDRAVADYNAGKSSNRQYTLDQQYNRNEAYKSIKMIAKDEIMYNENGETQPLMETYSKWLTKLGSDYNSWEIEATVKYDDHYNETVTKVTTLEDCKSIPAIEFDTDGTFIMEDCDGDSELGQWSLSGAKLILKYDKYEDEFYISFINGKLYIKLIGEQQVQRWSKSSGIIFPPRPDSLPPSLTGE